MDRDRFQCCVEEYADLEKRKWIQIINDRKMLKENASRVDGTDIENCDYKGEHLIYHDENYVYIFFEIFVLNLAWGRS